MLIFVCRSSKSAWAQFFFNIWFGLLAAVRSDGLVRLVADWPIIVQMADWRVKLTMACSTTASTTTTAIAVAVGVASAAAAALCLICMALYCAVVLRVSNNILKLFFLPHFVFNSFIFLLLLLLFFFSFYLSFWLHGQDIVCFFLQCLSYVSHLVGFTTQLVSKIKRLFLTTCV